jgi:hypothetical protein
VREKASEGFAGFSCSKLRRRYVRFELADRALVRFVDGELVLAFEDKLLRDDCREDPLDEEVFDDLPADEPPFDLLDDSELLLFPLFALPELFDETDRPFPTADCFSRGRPEPLSLLEPVVEFLPLFDRLPLLDLETLLPDPAMFSAAAPIAPTAAPVTAPLSISPATSTTLSIMLAEADLFDLELPFDEVDEDVLFFFEPLEIVLLAINFLPNDRIKKLDYV